MAHITEIKIDGLLGRSTPVHYQLERDVNIFFGENGCGKTTLLKIFDAAMNRDGVTMERLPVERAEIHIFSLTENKVIKHLWERKTDKPAGRREVIEHIRPWESEDIDMRWQVERYMRVRESANEWRLSPAKNIHGRKHTTTEWAHTFLPTTRLFLGKKNPAYLTSGKTELSEEQLDDLFAESINRTWLLFYSETLNEVRKIQEEGLKTVLDQVLDPSPRGGAESLLDPKEAYDRLVNFLSRQERSNTTLGGLESFKKRYQREPELQRVVGNLDKVERSIEEAMAPIDKFRTTLETLFSRGKKVVTSENNLRVMLETGAILPMASLSSGEKQLLKLLLAAMTGAANSVIIDEPELSMHIDWQRVFVRTMQSLNPSCQLIIASHSPEIMAEIGDKNIFVL